MSGQYRYDFLARMNAAKNAARRDVDEGGSTVRVFSTMTALAAWRGDEAPTDNDESRARWEHSVSQFIEDLRFDLYGDQWEGLEI